MNENDRTISIILVVGILQQTLCTAAGWGASPWLTPRGEQILALPTSHLLLALYSVQSSVNHPCKPENRFKRDVGAQADVLYLRLGGVFESSASLHFFALGCPENVSLSVRL